MRRENVTGRVLPDAALVSLEAITRAEYQGYDDGYFGNPQQLDFPSETLRLAYDSEFERGVKGRARADAFAGEPAKPKKAR